MPKYPFDKEEIIRMAALHKLIIAGVKTGEKTDDQELARLRTYSKHLKNYLENRKNQFDAAITSYQKSHDINLEPVFNLSQDVELVQNRLNELNDLKKPELEEVKNKSVVSGKYDIQDTNASKMNNMVQEVEYQTVVMSVVYTYDKQYKAYLLDSTKKRDTEINKLTDEMYEQAVSEAKKNKAYIDLCERSENAKKEFDVQIANLRQGGAKNKDIQVFTKLASETETKADEESASLLAKLSEEIYKNLYAQKKSSIDEINTRYQTEAEEKLREYNKQANAMFANKIQNVFQKNSQEANKYEQEIFDKELAKEIEAMKKNPAPYFQNNEEEVEKVEGEKKAENVEKVKEVEEVKEVEKVKEVEEVKEADKPKVEEEVKEEPKPELKTESKEEPKPELKTESKEEPKIVVKVEDSNNIVIDYNLSQSSKVKAPNRPSEYKQYLTEQQNAVKDAFDDYRANCGVLRGDHIDRINALYKMLKNDRKWGLSGNTKEYKEVLRALSDYQTCLTDTGAAEAWSLVQRGEDLSKIKDGKALENARILQDKLDNVFDKAVNYMEKKGPERKYYAHGQRRYDWMYLLCEEIYPGGGHVADLKAQIKKVDAEIASGKTKTQDYIHQILTPSLKATVADRYNPVIDKVIHGGRVNENNPDKRIVGVYNEIRLKIVQNQDKPLFNDKSASNSIGPQNIM